MVNTDSSTRVAVLRQISDQDVKNLLEHMPSDEAVEVLEDSLSADFGVLLRCWMLLKRLKFEKLRSIGATLRDV